MRTIGFANRTAKEILRDPLSLVFGLALPVLLLVIMSIIDSNVEISIFPIEHLAPGMAVFGASFMVLFSSILIAQDRATAFAVRLYATPMTSADFILGYTLPIVPICLAQGLIIYLVSLIFGLKFSVNILYALAGLVPIALFYIALGLLLGSVLSVKAVGGVAGGAVVNFAALFSGVWFDLSMLGDGASKFFMCLPFANILELEKDILNASYDGTIFHFLWVLGYTVLVFVIAILLFLRQMKKQ